MPALRAEIRGLLEALDSGVSVSAEGVADPLVRTGLQALLAVLGLEEDGEGGVRKPSNDDSGSLTQLLSRVLSDPLGPQLPPGGAAGRRAEEEEEEKEFGPKPSAHPARPSGPTLPLLDSRRGGRPAPLPLSFPTAAARARSALEVPAAEAGVDPSGREAWMTAVPKELAGVVRGAVGSASAGGPSALPARLRIDKSAPGYDPSQPAPALPGGAQSLLAAHVAGGRAASALTSAGGWKPWDRDRDIAKPRVGGAAAAARATSGPSALTEMFGPGTFESSFL
jgi:hypothetical protein